jgi:hypothetical protein
MFSGFFGRSCNFNSADYNLTVSIRDALCSGLAYSQEIQDVSSSEVILSRAVLVTNILSDISLVTDEGLEKCTSTLVNSIVSNPSLLGSSDVANMVMKAISNVFVKGASLSHESLMNMTLILTALTEGLHTNMATGQSFASFNTQSLRLKTGLVDSNDLAELTLSPPLTSYEEIMSPNKTIVTVSTSNTSASAGIVIFEYNSNPHGSGLASNAIGLQLMTYDEDSNRRRKLVASSDDVHYTITLMNVDSVNYEVQDVVNGLVECLAEGTPYNITISCPHVQPFNQYCDGEETKQFHYRCPEALTRPQCLVYDAAVNYQVADDDCTVVAFDAFTTTCRCRSSTNTRRHLMTGGQSTVQEFATRTTITADSINITQISVEKAPRSSRANNMNMIVIIIATIIGAIACFCFLIRYVFPPSRRFDAKIAAYELNIPDGMINNP